MSGLRWPSIRRLVDRREGRLVHFPDLWTEDERRTSPVYNEGWRRMGAQDGVNAHFRDPDGLRLVWSLGDPVGGGGWEPTRLRLVARLLPHVRQFVRVRQALAAAEALGSGLAGLPDNSRIGAVQLDRGGRILDANAVALEILRTGDGLLDREGVLGASFLPIRKRTEAAPPASGRQDILGRKGSALLLAVAEEAGCDAPPQC